MSLNYLEVIYFLNLSFISTADLTTLLVTKFEPLLGDSWLNRIPF